MRTKKEHTYEHGSPLVYSYMLIRSKPVLLVRVDRHMAPMKAVAFFWQIEAI